MNWSRVLFRHLIISLRDSRVYCAICYKFGVIEGGGMFAGSEARILFMKGDRMFKV